MTNLTLFDAPHGLDPNGGFCIPLTGPGSRPRRGPLVGLSRTQDPSTSHQAAQRQRGGLSAPILEAFEMWGPMSDDRLCHRLGMFHPPSIKTARSRLSKAGLLVATGETVLSDRGSPMMCWRLA